MMTHSTRGVKLFFRHLCRRTYLVQLNLNQALIQALIQLGWANTALYHVSYKLSSEFTRAVTAHLQ